MRLDWKFRRFLATDRADEDEDERDRAGRGGRPGDFPVPLIDVVANCITIRGSFVGAREDIAEALSSAAPGQGQGRSRTPGLGRHEPDIQPSSARLAPIRRRYRFT
jgi:hypothetical protein